MCHRRRSGRPNRSPEPSGRLNKPPAFQLYARDWIVDTARLTLEEEGAYMRLLSHQWIEGPLPNDPSELSRILGVTRTRFRRLWTKLSRFFPTIEEGRVANPRLEGQREEQAAFRASQSDRGRSGAAKRWGSDGHANALPPATPPPSRDDSHEHGQNDGQTMALQSATAPAPAPAKSQKQKKIYTPEFEMMWAVFPRREGGNPKDEAYRAWCARIAEGESAENLIAGVQRYARFCVAKGKIGTEWVQQTATFFGRKKSYAESWDFSTTESRDPRDPREGETGDQIFSRLTGGRA